MSLLSLLYLRSLNDHKIQISDNGPVVTSVVTIELVLGPCVPFNTQVISNICSVLSGLTRLRITIFTMVYCAHHGECWSGLFVLRLRVYVPFDTTFSWRSSNQMVCSPLLEPTVKLVWRNLGTFREQRWIDVGLKLLKSIVH